MPQPNHSINTSFKPYILLGYLTAFLVEVASSASGDSQIFKSVLWPAFFIIWYGLVYIVFYAIFRHRPLWQVVIAAAIFGPIVEFLLFRHAFLISDLGYAVMIGVPFWLARRLFLRPATYS